MSRKGVPLIWLAKCCKPWRHSLSYWPLSLELAGQIDYLRAISKAVHVILFLSLSRLRFHVLLARNINHLNTHSLSVTVIAHRLKKTTQTFLFLGFLILRIATSEIMTFDSKHSMKRPGKKRRQDLGFFRIRF